MISASSVVLSSSSVLQLFVVSPLRRTAGASKQREEAASLPCVVARMAAAHQHISAATIQQQQRLFQERGWLVVDHVFDALAMNDLAALSQQLADAELAGAVAEVSSFHGCDEADARRLIGDAVRATGHER